MIEGPPGALANESKMVLTDQVLTDVLAKLKLTERWNNETQSEFTHKMAMKALRDSLKLDAIDGTSIMNLRAIRMDKLEAAEIANEVTQSYLANRLLHHSKGSEAKLAQLEEEIEIEKLAIRTAQNRIKQMVNPHLEEEGDMIEAVANAKNALNQADLKQRFVQTIPFEEWPYYTNFDWGDEYASAIKDLMNANVTLKYLSKNLGADNPKVTQATATRDSLKTHLLPIVAEIKRTVSDEQRAAKVTVQNMTQMKKPAPALTSEQLNEKFEIEQELQRIQIKYQALVDEANKISPAEIREVKVTVIQYAKP